MKVVGFTFKAILEIEFAKGARWRGLYLYFLALARRNKVLISPDLDAKLLPSHLAGDHLCRGCFWDGDLSWTRYEYARSSLYYVQGELIFEPDVGTHIGRLADLNGQPKDVVVGFRRHGDAPLILPTRCELHEGVVRDSTWHKNFDEGENDLG